MLYIHRIKNTERGLLYRAGDFVGLLAPGRHLHWGLPGRVTVKRVSVRQPDFVHSDLDVVLRTVGEHPELRVLDLRDHQRAVVTIDGRLHGVYGPGRHALWQVDREIDVDILDVADVLLRHPALSTVLALPSARALLEPQVVEPGRVGLFYVRGELREVLKPGVYGVWRQGEAYALRVIDTREQGLDVDGQEIMTSDKVSLRVNAHLVYRVTDPVLAADVVKDLTSAIYRAVQLALRAVVGTRELDALLVDRDSVVNELRELTAGRVASLGVAVVDLGIRDVILPGEMKTILNRVTEARKAAEASLITRREEVAAARSQANTAKILADNPVLMRLRELETLERITASSDIQISVGEKSLGDFIKGMV